MEILDEAKKTVPSIGMATVYRELRRLQDEGDARQVNLPGEPPRFIVVSGATPASHHFKCSSCQRVFPLEDTIPDLATRLPSQFKHESHQLVVFGTCANGCAA